MQIFARAASIWVYNTILSYVRNIEDAEEVTQDTLVSALAGLHKFKSEASLKTWVYRIAINKSKDFLKYKTRQKRHGNVISIHRNVDTEDREMEIPSFMHPGVQLESKEQMEILFEGINSLPESQKEAIVLSKLEQMSTKEIAEIMKTSPKAVESLISRAKSNLKKFLETEGIEIYKKRK